MAAQDIGLDEIERKFEHHARGRDRLAARFKVADLIIRIGIQLIDLSAKRTHGEMMDRTLELAYARAGNEIDTVMHRRF